MLTAEEPGTRSRLRWRIAHFGEAQRRGLACPYQSSGEMGSLSGSYLAAQQRGELGYMVAEEQVDTDLVDVRGQPGMELSSTLPLTHTSLGSFDS